MNFPRFALSDGQRLFIADSGNDRVLVYNSIPTKSGEPADIVLGQIADTTIEDTDQLRISASDTTRTPTSLAWDGTNLYVADPFNLQVLVFSVADQVLPITGVRNGASKNIFAVGTLTFNADPKENDEVTLKIGSGSTALEYKYKAAKDQTIAHVITGLVTAVNAGAGDPLVFASPNLLFNSLILSAREPGAAGNDIAYAVTYSQGAQIGEPASGTLSGGQDAAKIAPGTAVMIIGDDLAQQTASAPLDANPLPSTLGGVEVYFDGIRAPLYFVSPTEIRAQIPWEVNDAHSINAYVRIARRDGTVRTTAAIGVPIIPQNPGIFAEDEPTDPRPARAFHASSYATGVVSIDGSIKAGDQAIISISDRNYGYTVQAGDTLSAVRDALIAQISADDPEADAVAATAFTRIILRARIPGQEGEGIAYSAKTNEGASIIMTALSASLCCASTEGAPITLADPARPGEMIRVFATGLGLVLPDEAKFSVSTGWKYDGPPSTPNSPVDAIAGGKTANVLFAGLAPGTVGVYELTLQLNSDIPSNPKTQLTIAQDIYISNIVTFAVANPGSSPE